MSFSPPTSLRRVLAAAALVALAACGGAERESAAPAAAAVTATDDAGRAVTLPRPATRIVALMPSATETLVALGARNRLVGRNDFDTGMGVDSLPSVGGGLDPSVETIVSLRPDLVIGWETQGPGALRERLEALGIPVFTMKTEDTTDVFRAIRNLGALTGLGSAADSLSISVRRDLDAVRRSVEGRSRPTVFYMAWHDPPTTAGPRTFVAQLIEAAGGTSVFPEPAALWPTVSLEELVRRQPDVIIVPDAEHGARRVAELRDAPGWRELRAIREGSVVLLPADVVNRPGPRIGAAARRLRDVLHPMAAGQ